MSRIVQKICINKKNIGGINLITNLIEMVEFRIIVGGCVVYLVDGNTIARYNMIQNEKFEKLTYIVPMSPLVLEEVIWHEAFVEIRIKGTSIPIEKGMYQLYQKIFRNTVLPEDMIDSICSYIQQFDIVISTIDSDSLPQPISTSRYGISKTYPMICPIIVDFVGGTKIFALHYLNDLYVDQIIITSNDHNLEAVLHIENNPSGILKNILFEREEFPRDKKFKSTNVYTPLYFYRVQISAWMGNHQYDTRKLSIISNLGGQIMAIVSNKFNIEKGMFALFRADGIFIYETN
jgi:hypothetical protein